eukprot:GHVN01106929.1.p1 GENE.GHVN01106929.1~~GHVN01106929.1.p1  ORF type:complete len:479 (-),score=50.51 GHVN01106929.1:124-1560(-)
MAANSWDGIGSENAFNQSYDGFPWLWSFVCFISLLQIFEQYLNVRQYRQYCLPQMTDTLRDSKITTQEDFSKSQHYSRDKMMFSMVVTSFDFLLKIGFLVLFVYPKIWLIAGLMVGSNEYLQTLTFCLLMLTIDTIKAIPTSLYLDFVIEERHGFNKKTYSLFFKDWAKEFVLSCVLGGPILCGVMWIINWGGKNFYIYLWVFVVLTALVMMILYPNLIAPLFNKYEHLKNKKLANKIEKLAGELDFPLKTLYEVDASTRSSHSNAYFYGFWKWKRIVLFDTLLEAAHDQILAILAHELGHWKLNHTVKAMVVSFTHLFGVVYLFSLVMGTASLYQSFGFGDVRAVIVGLLLFLWIFSPIDAAISLLCTYITRRHEFQADAFAVNLGFAQPLKDGLVRICVKSKVALCPDRWYALYHYSHPPLLERMDAISMRAKEFEEKGGKPHQLVDGEPPPQPAPKEPPLRNGGQEKTQTDKKEE